MDIDEARRAYVAQELDLDGLRAAAQDDPTEQGSQVLMLLTEYENSDWDEAELRVRVGEQLAKG
jgi:hypothetical protein